MDKINELSFRQAAVILENLINLSTYEDLHHMRLKLKDLLADLENKQYRLFRESSNKVSQ